MFLPRVTGKTTRAAHHMKKMKATLMCKSYCVKTSDSKWRLFNFFFRLNSKFLKLKSYCAIQPIYLKNAHGLNFKEENNNFWRLLNEFLFCAGGDDGKCDLFFVVMAIQFNHLFLLTTTKKLKKYSPLRNESSVKRK